MFIALKNGDGISEGCEDYYSLGCKIETELTAANEKIDRLTVGLANEIKNKGPLVLIHERDSLQSRLTQIKQAGENIERLAKLYWHDGECYCLSRSEGGSCEPCYRCQLGIALKANGWNGENPNAKPN